MLGSLGRNKNWIWCVRGKHPGLKDYFSLGADSPMLAAFADWIEKGYRGLAEHSSSLGSLISYRFWLGGPHPGALVCGVVKDSSDSVGRPYPLILIGMGPLRDWENHWDQLPMAFEAAWCQLESISTRIYRDFKQLDGDLRTMKPPSAEWGAGAGGTESCGSGSGGEGSVQEEEDTLIQRMASDVLYLPVAGDRFGDSTSGVRKLHAILRTFRRDIPKAVFMGGKPTLTRLVVFRRPLLAEDFGRLWFEQPVP
jgi:type VI secretion system protein VasJ